MTEDPPGTGASVEARLRASRLATVFAATSSSYKFYWFLALMDELPRMRRPTPVSLVIRSMVVRAWSTVAQYRLSLGRTDRLQLCVLELQAHARLAGVEPKARIHDALDAWPDLPRWTEDLARFVPGRFLGAWFPDVARSRPYDRRGARDVAVAAGLAWGTADEGPYRLLDRDGTQMIELSPAWAWWLTENEALVRGYAERRLCGYLQARNPGVPGIVDKLEAPGRRALAGPRRWWTDLIGQGGALAVDIYTGAPLDADFDVDHFLPWTFVAHDEWWNLAPTTAAANRSKGDRIPDLDLFLPRLADLHAEALAVPDLPPAVVRGYSDFLGFDVTGPGRPPRDVVASRYRDLVRPLAQIASNQGFPGGWRPASQ